MNQFNIYTLQQPIVYVNSGGCANFPIYFETSASGNLQWFFGAGSNPSSSSGAYQKVEYNSIGSKTFTLVNNGIAYTYTNFINILYNGTNGHPEISSTDSLLCLNDIGNYSTSTLADNYIWQVIRPDGIDTFEGASVIQISNYVFDTSGSYNIVLQTYDNCCGFSFPDTFNVQVDPIVKPMVSLSCSDTDLVICSGDEIHFLATDSLAGNSPTFEYQVNGIPIISNNNALSSTSLTNGSLVYCIVTSSQHCSSNLKDTSNGYFIDVIDAPQISCSADSFILGSPTVFQAQVNSGGLAPFDFQWDFGDSTFGSGDSLLHMYPEVGPYTYSLLVTDSNGCTGTCNGSIMIISNLEAAFEADTLNGCSPLNVNFSNLSSNAISYLWDFGDGQQSVQTDPIHIFNQAGTYDVSLKAFGANGADTMEVISQILVYEKPTANFQAFPQYISSMGDSVHFADNSIGASSWIWDFGDPSSGVQNNSNLQNPIHYYASNGQYDVILIVGNDYNCSDSISKLDFIQVEFNTGIESTQLITLNIYPTLFKDYLNIEIKEGSLLKEKINVRFYNLNGQRVEQEDININQSINTSSWSNGQYIIVLNYENKQVVKKVIKQ